MPRIRMVTGIALLCATALTVAGCKNSAGVFQDNGDGGWFSKPVEMFSKPEWTKNTATTANLGPSGPVGPEELVNADGSCAMAAAAAPPPATPDQPPGAAIVSVPSGPQVMGGVALGMSECQVVQRAGSPSNVQIGSGASGERSVTLTFLNPPWPGIYRFSDGRLKVVERAPGPPPTAKAPPKKKKAAKKTS
ncbi:MAG TPA: hypothetical protein VGM57_14170 [Pseudolabrys sp.]